MRTSLSFFPNTTKRSSKSGKIPLYLRIIHNGRKAEARLNEEITDNELFKWNPFVMRLDIKDSQLNSKLNTITKTYDDFKIIYGSTLHLYDAKKIRDMLVGNGSTKDQKIYEYAKSYYVTAVSANNGLSGGTRKNYIKALKHLEKFIRIKNYDVWTFSALNNQFAVEFWDYLLSNYPDHKKKGMSEVSASGIVKKFRTIFDRAVNENLITKNPFRIIRLKTKSAFRQKLTNSEVAAWFKCDLAKFPALSLYKDIFLFGCLTGLAYSDIMSLEWSHLKELQSDDLLLRKNRHKTGEQTEIILTSYTKNILMNFKSFPETAGTQRVFPPRSLNSINNYNRVIADKTGITAKVTTHIARHTFRQLIANASIEDESVIRRMMGQSRGNSIDAVYYNVTESRLLEAKRKFELYLLSILSNDR
jgi:integrase